MFTHKWKRPCLLLPAVKAATTNILPPEIFVGQNIRGFRGWRSDHESHKWRDFADLYLQWKQQPQIFCPRNFRGAKYSWFSWLKVWPRMYYPRMKQPCLPLPAVKAATTNILPQKFSWGKIFVVFVVEGLTTNILPTNETTLSTFTCSESSNHKYFAPENFHGAKYSWFSWLKVWPRIHKWSDLADLYLQWKQQPQIFCPRNFRGAKYSWFSWLKVWPRIFYPQMKRPCRPLPAVKAQPPKYFAPEIFVGQNIRGFRGWRSDHECLPTNESDLAYFYLQWKQQPQIFCPRKFSWGKIFVVFVVEGLTTIHKWSDLADLYLQWKQQPQIFCPRNFRGAKYSWFSWLKVWPRMFTHKWKRPCLLLPAVKAATTNILPPEIFVGQNIRGFRGWRSDHEYFTHKWSDLAYFYLQWKQQPQIFCPQNFRGAKYSWFSWLKVWPRIFCPRTKRPCLPLPVVQAPTTAKYSWFSWLKVWPRMFTHKWKRPCLLLPAVKAATTNILPPKFSWGKIFVVFVVEGLTTNILPTNEATLPTFTCSASSNHKY